MKIAFRKVSKIILEVLMTLSMAFYLIMFVEEISLPYSSGFFGWLMVGILFALFLMGYSYLWKNKRISGIITVLWYCLILLVGFFVWTDAGMVIGLGFPAGILGILLIIWNKFYD